MHLSRIIFTSLIIFDILVIFKLSILILNLPVKLSFAFSIYAVASLRSVFSMAKEVPFWWELTWFTTRIYCILIQCKVDQIKQTRKVDFNSFLPLYRLIAKSQSPKQNISFHETRRVSVCNAFEVIERDSYIKFIMREKEIGG